MAACSTAPARVSESASPINSNPDLQSYYGSLESRIGYRLLLGGTRHFGYWAHDTWWPFPLSSSLRRMEDQLGAILHLPRGFIVLDAGCGVGHVALHVAEKLWLRIQPIDIVDRHIAKARANVAKAEVPAPGGAISVRRMDYHHLEVLESASLDGVYTMETFVHATDPAAVLAGFYRLKQSTTASQKVPFSTEL